MNGSLEDYCRYLAEACASASLASAVLRDPAQVRVWEPGLDYFAELVSCKADSEGVYFVWSWGTRICPASWVTEATEAIARVASPSYPQRGMRSRRSRQ